MADGVIDGWQATVQLLSVTVTARGLLAQSSLEVLQLTQEVEIWGNRWPSLFHKPFKGTERESGLQVLFVICMCLDLQFTASRQ